jgi:hypothetical protein
MSATDDSRRLPSPNGTHVLVLTAYEAMNSQWVEAGTVIRARDEALLVEIGEWNWHVDSALWLADDRLQVALRRFPGDVAGLTLTLDLTQGFAERTADAGGDADHPRLDTLSEWLERWYLAQRAKFQRP